MITIRVELRRAPDMCKERCYPHEGVCGAAQASWRKKPTAASIQAFLGQLLRSTYEKMEGDKLVFALVKKE